MDAITLGAAITDDGVRSVNFFNGRLLSGRDLGRDQDARRLADQRLGQATGPGIAYGLEVSLRSGDAAGLVRISAGLALAPSGQTLWLASDCSVDLVQPLSTTASAVAGDFGPCGVLSGSSYVAGDGVYLLTLSPTTVSEGRAAVLASSGGDTSCTTDVIVEAVRFRLLPVNGFEPTGTGDAAVAKLRNELAYAVFAPTALTAAHANPTLARAGGLLDTLRSQNLSDCDAPLALVYMVGSAVVFVDRWSVRRRLAADPASALGAAWVGERRVADAQAIWAQFQDHLADQPTIATAAASARLAWLPPVAFLDGNAAWQTFLGAQAPSRLVDLAAGDVAGVFAAALQDDPVAVGSSTRFRVYRVASGPLMMVRDARNTVHAEQVWFDGSRIGLPAAADVQAAIETLRGATCLHRVVRAGTHLASLFASFSGVGATTDLTLCFEPGDYTVNESMVLSGLGHVEVHGLGARLINSRGECALRVDSCKSFYARDIGFEGRIAGSGKDELGIGLEGALTVVDTHRIRVERVRAQSAAGRSATARKTAAAVAAAGAAAAKVQAAVKDLVKASAVESLTGVTKGGTTSATTGASVPGPVPIESTTGSAAGGIALEASSMLLGIRGGSLATYPDAVIVVTDSDLIVGAGQCGLCVLNPPAATISRNHVSAAFQEPMREGIVVAGAQAGRVAIDHNRVDRVEVGILTAFSVGADDGLSHQADRIEIAHNRVGLKSASVSQRLPRTVGIVVGNAQVLLVEGNHVSTAAEAAGIKTRNNVIGLLLEGDYGPLVRCTGNLFENTFCGIQWAESKSPQPKLWTVQYNIQIGTSPLVLGSSVYNIASVVEHNIPERDSA